METLNINILIPLDMDTMTTYMTSQLLRAQVLIYTQPRATAL